MANVKRADLQTWAAQQSGKPQIAPPLSQRHLYQRVWRSLLTGFVFVDERDLTSPNIEFVGWYPSRQQEETKQ